MTTATALFLLASAVLVAAQRQLSLPDRRSCDGRVKHTSWRDPSKGTTHNYIFSWQHDKTASLAVDWLDARNICRRHCMDLVSLETLDENAFLKEKIASSGVKSVWTSGRKCNFFGCQARNDLQPNLIKGWFWSGSNTPIGATNVAGNGDWSNTGGSGKPQPDNREIQEGHDEACLAIQNNVYNDGVRWHDVACHHEKPFICEDSDELLQMIG